MTNAQLVSGYIDHCLLISCSLSHPQKTPQSSKLRPATFYNKEMFCLQYKLLDAEFNFAVAVVCLNDLDLILKGLKG